MTNRGRPVGRARNQGRRHASSTINDGVKDPRAQTSAHALPQVALASALSKKRRQRFQREQRDFQEQYQLISRSDDKRLLKRKEQERFYEQLSSQPVDAKGLVDQFRILRESLYASQLVDGFVISVYESSAKVAIVNRAFPEAMKALSHLVGSLYRSKSQCDETSLRLYEELVIMEYSTPFNVRGLFRNRARLSSDTGHLRSLLRAVMAGNWARLRKLRETSTISGSAIHALLLGVYPKRLRVLEVLRKAYLKAPVEWVEEQIGASIPREILIDGESCNFRPDRSRQRGSL